MFDFESTILDYIKTPEAKKLEIDVEYVSMYSKHF